MRFSSRFLLGFVLSLVCVCAATAQKAPTVVIVVRHADKDTIPKADPPLTAAGVVRAKALAAALADASCRRSSPRSCFDRARRLGHWPKRCG